MKTKKTAALQRFQLYCFIICTQNKTRTCTAVRPLVPETSVSTDSTTWAYIQWTLKKKPCNFPAARPLFCLLSHKDSNLDWQNQNLLCYHYTMGQSSCQFNKYFVFWRCKCIAIFHFTKTKCGKIKRKLLFSCGWKGTNLGYPWLLIRNINSKKEKHVQH